MDPDSDTIRETMSIKKSVLWTRDFIYAASINVLIFLGMQMQLSALPVYLRELSGSDSAVGICIAFGTAAALLARPLAGYAVDRFGRRAVLFIGLLLMTGAIVSYSWFPIVWVIIMIRSINGFSWGAVTTVSNTIAADVIPGNRLGEGMGFFSLSQSISMALAPVTGLLIMETFGYRNMTLTAATMLVVACVPAMLIKYKKIEKNRDKAKFVPYEKTAMRPAIVMIFVGIPLGAALSFSALYGRSLGFSNGALFLSCFAVSMLVSRPITGRLIDRFGFSSVIFPGFILYIASMVFLSMTDSLHAFICVALLQGMAYGAVQNSLQTMSIVNAPSCRRGAANATFFTGFDFGIGLGNLFAGTIAAAIGYSQMYLSMSIPLAIGMVLYFFIAKYVKRS